jgi:hypothetical protein
VKGWGELRRTVKASLGIDEERTGRRDALAGGEGKPGGRHQGNETEPELDDLDDSPERATLYRRRVARNV